MSAAPLRPGFEVDKLSDEELDYFINLQQKSTSDLSKMSDEELNTYLGTFEAPSGNIDPNAPIVYEKPAPELTAGQIAAGGVRELASGAAFEFADEAEAAARAPFSDKSYEQILREVRDERARFREAYPGTATTLNVAGGVGSMFVPGANVLGRTAQAATGISRLGSPLARTVASSALAGGVAGVGAGESPEQRLQYGATGAALGAPFGVAARGVGRASQWLGDVFTARGAEMSAEEAAQHAAGIISQRMGRDNLQVPDLRERLALEQRYGIPPTIGTVSPELSRLAETVVQTPSEAQGDLARRLFEQQAGAPERVQRLVRENIPTPDYFASEENILNTLRSNAKRLYGAVEDVEINDPRINQILSDPDIRGAYADALANVRRDMTAASLRGEDPAQYQLREIFEPILSEEGALVGLSETGKQIPDIRTLNQIKIALDRKIDGLYSTGRGGEATALKNVRNAFVDRLDQIGPPEYRAARQQYKGDIEIRDALQAGRDANRMRWQEVRKFSREASPGELQAFKTGYVQRLMQGFEDTSRRRNFAREIIDNRSQRNKLQALMDPGEFQVFEAAMRREAELFDTISRTTGGSATAGRLAARQDIEQQIAGGNVEEAASLLLNPTPGNILQRVLRITANMRNANVSRATYTQLARMLRAGDPDEVERVLRQLEEAAPAQRAADETLERGTTKAAAGLATSIAPPPEEGGFREDKPFKYTPATLEEEPSAGLSAMPGSPSASAGPGGPGAGTTNVFDAIFQIMPDFQMGLADGSIISSAGAVMEAPDVAKALGIPLQAWLSYARGQ